MTVAASTLSRRSFLTAVGGAVAAVATARSAGASSPAAGPRATTFRVAVATNEPWGTYHVRALLDDIEARGGELVLVVPDRSGIRPGDSVPVMTIDEVRAWGPDLLVVNGATEWPTTVTRALPDLPIVASALAYMNPVEGVGAAVIRPRLVDVTASSEAEAETFAVHLGWPAQRVRVVGNPQLDDRPTWAPETGTVLVLTSVTYPSSTGSAAPGTELLLASAHALQDAGWTVIVGLHPREDRSLWSDFEIAEEGSLAASARAEVAVGIPGSIFPLVAVVDPALTVPDYLLEISTPASTVPEVLAAVNSAESLDRRTLRRYVGSLDRAGRTLVQVWFAATHRARRVA